MMLLLILWAQLLLVSCQPKALFEEVPSTAKFDVRDSTGMEMDCLHVYETQTPELINKFGNYFGVYHTHVANEYQVRLAASNSLLEWTFVRTLLPNADMPLLRRVGSNGPLLLTHEQWMTPGSAPPCRVGFKLYSNEASLFGGNAEPLSFLAPLSVGASSRLEGTPSLYDVSIAVEASGPVVNAHVGFHFNDQHGVDVVAQGNLTGFGPSASGTPRWTAQQAISYDQLYRSRGARGNIGQRDSGVVGGQRLVLQEANLAPMPPTDWSAWRVWLYVMDPSETIFPAGRGQLIQLNPKTPKGSTSFCNPSFTVVKCPNQQSRQCLVVSYFLLGEGAGPGEAKSLVFYKPLEISDEMFV